MTRLTTDAPEGNTQHALNLFYVKDGEAWVREYGKDGTDITLNELVRSLIKWHCPYVDMDIDDWALAEMMNNWLDEDPSDMEHVFALLYQMGWAFAELRAKLKAYEASGLTPEMCKSISGALAKGRGTAVIAANRAAAVAIAACILERPHMPIEVIVTLGTEGENGEKTDV